VLDRWLNMEDAPAGEDGQTPPPAPPPTPPAAPAAPAPAAFDPDLLLERLAGDEALVKLLIATFLEDIPVQLNLLEAALAEDDHKLVGQQAHKIKGAAANLSAMAIWELAQTLEQAGKEGNQALINELLPRIKNEFMVFTEKTRQYL
jgi:HPt (histidine-containing phosphotransfer) domain-containing protein